MGFTPKGFGAMMGCLDRPLGFAATDERANCCPIDTAISGMRFKYAFVMICEACWRLGDEVGRSTGGAKRATLERIKYVVGNES